MTASPAQIAAAWRAFRGDRPGTLLGPGTAFREAIDAAMAVGEVERAAVTAEWWPHYLTARDGFHEAVWDDGEARFEMSNATVDARTALDAAVHRLAGMG